MSCPIVVTVIVALAVIAIICVLYHRKPKPETKPVGYPTNGNQPKSVRPQSQHNPAVVHRDREDFYDCAKKSPPQTNSRYPLGHPNNPNTHLLYGNSATYSDEPQTSSKRIVKEDCDVVSKPSESYQAESSKVSCYSSGSGSSSSYSSDSSYSSSSSSDSGSSSSSYSSSSSSD